MRASAGARPRVRRPRVVIVGANFGGMTVAQRLGPEYDVTVIDRSPWFEWLPSLHELLSGTKRPGDLRLPRARLVRRAGHRFVLADVVRLDARTGRVLTASGRELRFEVCVVATGGVDETFGVKGVERNTLGFKGVDECERIGRRLAALARRADPGSVVIVGGGFKGVEALGEILRRYRHVAGLSVTIVEGGPRLLPGLPPSVGNKMLEHCRALGVRVLTNTLVSAVTPTRVRLRSGKTVRSDLTIWTGGVTASPSLHEWGLASKPHQWAPVTADLRSKRFQNVFVIGDAAQLQPPLAKQAYYAIQMGRCVADNVRRQLAGRALRRYTPEAKPQLIAFGDLDTYLVAGRSVVASPALAALKEAVYQVTMAQFDPPFSGSGLNQLRTRLGSALRGVTLPTQAAVDARATLRSMASRRRSG